MSSSRRSLPSPHRAFACRAAAAAGGSHRRHVSRPDAHLRRGDGVCRSAGHCESPGWTRCSGGSSRVTSRRSWWHAWCQLLHRGLGRAGRPIRRRLRRAVAGPRGWNDSAERRCCRPVSPPGRLAPDGRSWPGDPLGLCSLGVGGEPSSATPLDRDLVPGRRCPNEAARPAPVRFVGRRGRRGRPRYVIRLATRCGGQLACWATASERMGGCERSRRRAASGNASPGRWRHPQQDPARSVCRPARCPVHD